MKGADLVLLDEPLANLDYKLREELREELPRIFSATGSIFVYATTEPSEALLLGGNTASLHEGRITQFGPTIEVFSRPQNLITAQTPVRSALKHPAGHQTEQHHAVQEPGGASRFWGNCRNCLTTTIPSPSGRTISTCTARSDRAIAVKAKVAVTEITGSESYMHIDVAGIRWVLLAPGIHNFHVNETIEVFMDPGKFYVFDRKDCLVVTPEAVTGA